MMVFCRGVEQKNKVIVRTIIVQLRIYDFEFEFKLVSKLKILGEQSAPSGKRNPVFNFSSNSSGYECWLRVRQLDDDKFDSSVMMTAKPTKNGKNHPGPAKSQTTAVESSG
jgi:hypothetical protein